MGACLSADLARLHVNVHTDPHYRSYCAMSERVNCETVAASDYAVFAGLPVAVWGLLAYVVMGLLTAFGLARRLPTPAWPFGALWWLAAVSCVYGVFLFVLSHFVIESVCLVCAGTYVVNVGLLAAAWIELKRAGVGPVRALREDLRTAVAKPALPVTLIAVSAVAVLVLEIAVPSYWHLETTRGPEGLPVGLTEEGHPWIGASKPKLTIVEYSDYQCHHCQRGHTELRKLVSEHPAKLRLVHRHYPLDQACNELLKRPFHEHACKYAVLAECAGEQGRFWEANDFLFAQGRRKEAVTAPELAAAIDLEAKALRACAKTTKPLATVTADLAEGRKLRIRGTPTYVVGDQTYPGKIPQDVLAPILGDGESPK